MPNKVLNTGDALPLFASYHESPEFEVSTIETKCGLAQESYTLSSPSTINLAPTQEKHLQEQSEQQLYNNICTICGDTFEELQALEKHFAVHINEVPFECPFCAYLYDTLNAFTDHILEHTPKFKLVPKVDAQPILEDEKLSDSHQSEQLEQPEPDQLIEEELCDTLDPVESPEAPPQEPKPGPLPWQTKDNKVRPHKCTECDRSFTLASSLALHNRRMHLHMKRYECSICRSTFVQSSDLYKHQRTHTGEKPYHCEVCDTHFSQRRNLRNHQKIHSTSKHKCSYCGIGFQHKASLNLHVKTHEGEKLQACTVCSIPYAHQKDLDLHVRLAHEIAPSDTVCPVCDETFNSRSELAQHSIKHTGEKPYTCDTCGKSFAHRTSLINHRVVHTGKKTYQCTYCGQAFGFSGNLKAHTRIHTGERPFECEICQKTFARSANLKEHLKTHTGERPVSCDLCGKSFTSSSGYVKHRKIHTGERPYKCNICSKSFVQMVHLNKHILTHTGEKPHECEVCHKFYRRKDTLAKHLQSHVMKETPNSEEQDVAHAIQIEFLDLHQ